MEKAKKHTKNTEQKTKVYRNTLGTRSHKTKVKKNNAHREEKQNRKILQQIRQTHTQKKEQYTKTCENTIKSHKTQAIKKQ